MNVAPVSRHPHSIGDTEVRTASAASDRRSRRIFANSGTLLVIATLLFNPLLCFLQTMGFAAAPALVAPCELAIIAIALALCLGEFMQVAFTGLVLFAGWLVAARLVNPAINLKIAIDIAVPLVFALVGGRFGTPEIGDKLVFGLSLLVFAVGLFEFVDLPVYERIFNIINFYIAKGGAEAQQATFSGTSLFVSGIRPEGEGRTLLAFLGSHRASSVFLEPLGAGNFGAICMAWVIARPGMVPARLMPIVLATFGTIILGDARFAMATSMIMLVLRMLPALRSNLFVLLLPLVAVVGLIGFATVTGHTLVDDTLKGRLFGSGRLLGDLSSAAWLGLDPVPIVTVDCGIAYVLTNLGIIVTAILWVNFALLRFKSRNAAIYVVNLSVFLVLAMSINASALSIKTAALMWFLYGAIQLRPQHQQSQPELVQLKTNLA